jgi:hypothetical protein
MILELKCIKQKSGKRAYAISKKGKVMGSAVVPIKVIDKGFNVDITFLGKSMKLFIPRLAASLSNRGKEGFSESSAAKFQAKDTHGRIVYERRGSGFFRGYWLWNVEINGQKRYEVYEIGLGRKGRYFVLKDGDKTLAMVSIALRSKNFLTHHTIYVQDKTYAGLGVILALFWDITHFLGYTPALSRSVQDHMLNTINKEVKRQFDPNFIPAVK